MPTHKYGFYILSAHLNIPLSLSSLHSLFLRDFLFYLAFLNILPYFLLPFVYSSPYCVYTFPSSRNLTLHDSSNHGNDLHSRSWLISKSHTTRRCFKHGENVVGFTALSLFWGAQSIFILLCVLLVFNPCFHISIFFLRALHTLAITYCWLKFNTKCGPWYLLESSQS